MKSLIVGTLAASLCALLARPAVAVTADIAVMERLVQKYAFQGGICTGGQCDPAMASPFRKIRSLCMCRDGTNRLGIMLFNIGAGADANNSFINFFYMICGVPAFGSDGSFNSFVARCDDWVPISK
jgi:hypothetical protein